ncbi:MAG: formyl transferase [Nitrospirae bacterium CG18_big_fil_WC_8_21_14_2_50_70_55]|nr:formyl transferase [Deltaproteobacteria bacterium]OIP66360.1 MAG: formyl transferase [Nitrospirae bacterium CG2_30_70_394]PIQ07220.1 MAG: formyl transferase [Nitrospirae bacterium CG18_big_fil_WC_8_21_14_2_50_70_55]PIU78493.1 MAG: formyl transferase [Nitrospirae bacterium CG06_land_8_20_14_3_00_70_43]PIW83212.1 MAG: formyl transferase [Nitrospirae bacterium CG_4_8_14_3_um_filter_70_85]PIX84412.1 MAG: formyl transferase [Nitrospirae bacterium CG_4_10_14_3_um_filter_70_108]PJB95668.1 MAG: fo
MSGRPRVLVLCGTAPRHLYVANCLCEGSEVVGIVHERGGEWTVKKVKRLLRPASLWAKVSRRWRDRGRYAGGGEARFFFGTAPPALVRPELVRWVPYINHPSVVALADVLVPDVIAVFGTTLIRGPLLERGRLGMLNLHGGLSPEYRGADCTFWALFNNEPEKIGCTLHFINAGIDTGNLVAHICPAVGAGDDELTLFWRAVRDSGPVYVEAIQQLAAGVDLGAIQSTKGHLYQVKQRQPAQERELARRLASGLLATVNLPPRVRWFHREGEG